MANYFYNIRSCNYLILQHCYKHSFVFNCPLILPSRPVKIFAFIMSILVLALSMMPCADKEAAFTKSKKEIETVKALHHQGCPLNDACSPFCQCSCCAGFSINHSVVAVPIMKIQASDPLTQYLPAKIATLALPIWQPPQLV